MVRLKQIIGARKHDETRQEKILQTKRDRYKPDTSVEKKKRIKPRKRRQLVIAEILHYQSTVENLLLKRPFLRLVKEILAKVQMDKQMPVYRMQCAAIRSLQEATESYIIDLMNDASVCALHAKRVKVSPKDFELVIRLSPKHANMFIS